MPKCWLIHGFNDRKSGADNVDKLGPFLERAGFEVAQFDYGWRGLFGVRFFNQGLAEDLARRVRSNDIAVAYSNGADIALKACMLSAPFKHLTLINPALDRDSSPPYGSVRTVNVWHSPSELPTRLARWLPFHPWGDMGAKGYKGADARVRNYNKERDYRYVSESHGDVFREPLLSYFGPIIVEEALRGG